MNNNQMNIGTIININNKYVINNEIKFITSNDHNLLYDKLLI